MIIWVVDQHFLSISWRSFKVKIIISYDVPISYYLLMFLHIITMNLNFSEQYFYLGYKIKIYSHEKKNET